MRYSRNTYQKHRAINTFEESFILISVATGTRENPDDPDHEGDFIPGTETRSIKQGSIEPVSKREDLMNLVPEGLKVSDLKWIFVTDDFEIKSMGVDRASWGSSGDYVLYPVTDGHRYKVISVSVWDGYREVLVGRVTAAPGFSS